MKETEIRIPATAEATSEYRQAQSAATIAREEPQAIEFIKGKPSIFRRGHELDRARSFAPAIGDWSPPGQARIEDLLPEALLKKVQEEFSLKGLAATIALTDTAAGVREVITYDENEEIVLSFLNGEANEEE